MSGIILTGVNGSETAQRAAEKAASLATALQAELHVLSAFTVDQTEATRKVNDNYGPIAAYAPTAINDAVKELTLRYANDAEHTAATAAATLRTKFPDLKITTRAAEGSPASALVTEAERVQADTIVVGNKRVQGVARLLGSVARTVASEAPCDLHIVNTHQR